MGLLRAKIDHHIGQTTWPERQDRAQEKALQEPHRFTEKREINQDNQDDEAVATERRKKLQGIEAKAVENPRAVQGGDGDEVKAEQPDIHEHPGHQKAAQIMGRRILRGDTHHETDEGQEEAKEEVHGWPSERDEDVVDLPGRWIGQGDLDRLTPPDEPKTRAKENHHSGNQERPNWVGMGQWVQGHPPLGSR